MSKSKNCIKSGKDCVGEKGVAEIQKIHRQNAYKYIVTFVHHQQN